jgi:hypothetical protein
MLRSVEGQAWTQVTHGFGRKRWKHVEVIRHLSKGNVRMGCQMERKTTDLQTSHAAAHLSRSNLDTIIIIISSE